MSGSKFNLDDHFSYDKSTDKTTCLTCRNVFNKRIPGNLKRHFCTQHPTEAAVFEDFSMKPQKIQRLDQADKRNQFLINVVKLVTKRFVSLSFFDFEEITEILEPWEDILDITIDSHLIREVITYAAKVVRIQIAEELKNSMIALKFDIATKAGRSILSINVQFIKSGKIVTRNLAMQQFNVIHTNDQIKKEIFEVFESYGIGIGQIICSTSDNAVNSIKTSELSNNIPLVVEETPDTEFESNGLNLNSSERFQIVQSVAQTFNLFVTDFLKLPAIDEKLELCRAVARKARTPINRRFFIRRDIPIPILDVSSRWSSTFAMVSFMRVFKEFIIKFIESIEPSILNFDWQFIIDIIECMECVNIALKNLQSDQLIIGDVYKNWLYIEIDLKALVGKNPLASQMLDLMNARKPGLFEAPVFKAGLFLDPRFNYLNSKHLSGTDKEIARVRIFFSNN